MKIDDTLGLRLSIIVGAITCLTLLQSSGMVINGAEILKIEFTTKVNITLGLFSFALISHLTQFLYFIILGNFDLMHGVNRIICNLSIIFPILFILFIVFDMSLFYFYDIKSRYLIVNILSALIFVGLLVIPFITFRRKYR
ncbi:hypothetical protein EW093_04975 [Thiospirochaeta perfilievii]|uniref:Uncharacterized protein n=1 Tax=Thiospirochaeta perfilievii TaxID=252967 RepID=A0A5C1Q9Q6_9SPIO|nr:hypothetical protein [Thiospirochaeta perfilievii]QEN04078.1 hypothetical protein EW093_04975 [Thiospirochaeta perfilievii]